jgi:hypothetical protein
MHQLMQRLGLTFSNKNSMYTDMANGNVVFLLEFIWELKVPLKIFVIGTLVDVLSSLKITRLSIIGTIIGNVVFAIVIKLNFSSFNMPFLCLYYEKSCILLLI